MQEILASFREAVKSPETAGPGAWAHAPPARPAPDKGRDEPPEVACLRLSAPGDDESEANVLAIDHVEPLERGSELASSHALAMRLGHLDDVRWRVAAMTRRPDAPRPPSQAEAIRRVVRDNFGQFEVCYEEGLHLDPALQGRVVVKFAIGSDGATEFAADGGSDLQDTRVVDCVVRAFSNLAFAPTGARVIVVYPLFFRPKDTSQKPPPTESPAPAGESTGVTPSHAAS
jgi:hypothetical protein